METEEKKYKTELILMNARNIKGNLFHLRKTHKKKLYQIANGFLKIKNRANIERNQIEESKYKMSGTQTVESDNIYNNNNNKTKKNKTPLNRNKKNKKLLFKEIKNICDNIYDSNNNKNDNFKIKLREDIIKSIDNYVFSDLRKNILFPKVYNKINNNKKILFKKKFKEKKQKEKEKNNEKEKEKELSFDSNKVSMKDILNNYVGNTKLSQRRIKVYKYNYKYGDYANNYIRYNHPQIYTLNNTNTFRARNIFPSIRPPKTLNQFHDFSNLIPEKKINKKEVNKEIYKSYKIMKIKNKNEIGIII